MITVELNVDDVEDLQEALKGTSRKLPRELSTAINATLKKVRAGISKDIREELTVTARSVNRSLSVSKSLTSSLKGTVTLHKEQRLSLKEFKPRQTKKGVTYRISKTRGRKTALGAFMGPVPGTISPKLHGHVFIRLERKERLPIAKLKGISPWGLYIKRKLDAKTRRKAERELSKQVQRRVRFVLLKKQGLI